MGIGQVFPDIDFSSKEGFLRSAGIFSPDFCPFCSHFQPLYYMVLYQLFTFSVRLLKSLIVNPVVLNAVYISIIT